MATAKGYTDDDRKRIVSDMQSMCDRLGGFFVRTYGDRFDGDIDTMLDAINFMKALRFEEPAAAVPEGGLRDSVLNSAKFRASCYALVEIVEGIEGLGRNWAANGERLKDTREWVAFYNCVAAMRNGTFGPASAEQASPAAAAVPAVPDGFELNLAVAESAIRKLVRLCPVTPPEAACMKSVVVGARAMLAANKENTND